MKKTSTERNIETDVRDAAAARGATVVECTAGHYQIKGRLLVNYYPFSKRRTAYVAQTTHGKRDVSPTEAVNMAFTAPPIANDHHKDDRGKNSRRKRALLIRRNGPHCHWCEVIVTLESSTLEHVIPLDRGGLDNANNRVLACRACNQARGNNMPELKAP